MQEEHKRAIQRNFSSLVDRTDLRTMASTLFERGVFSRAMFEEYCNENRPEVDRKRHLYRAITRRGPEAFNHLVAALLEIGQWDLVRDLDPNSPVHLRTSRRDPLITLRPRDDENSFVSLKENNRKIKPQNASRPEASGSLSAPAPVAEAPPIVQTQMPDSNGNDAIDLPSEIPDFQVKKSTSFFEEDESKGIKLYRARGRNRGTLLLFSYVKFKYGIDEERPGAEVDIRNLKYLFSEMGFKVLAYENLDWEETVSTFESLKQVLVGTETVFTVVSSHGYERDGKYDTDIRCSDGKVITDTRIIEFFNHNNMPQLDGVPKVFIFQVCRGSQEDYAETDMASSSVRTDSQAQPPASPPGSASRLRRLRRRPLYSDTLVVHSTVPGSVSHRDIHEGSWYIQALCEVFAQHAHNSHVDKLFKMVDELLQTRYHIQTSSVDSRGFNKKLFLHPGLFE